MTSDLHSVVAYVPDLMDRSRFGTHDVGFVPAPSALADAAVGAALVVVDLSRPGVLDVLEAVVAAGERVIGFAPHVDDELRVFAHAAGVEVLPRSRFFRDLDALLAP